MLFGEYIAFLDSDDYIEKTAYQEMYNKAKQENADMVECNFLWEYPNKVKEDIGLNYLSKKEMIEKARVVAWNKLIKKQILDELKAEFPEGLRYEDVEFFYKIALKLEKVSFVKKPFIHYVQRQNSIANTQNIKTKDIFKVLDNVILYYKEQNCYEEYKEQLEYIYVRFLLCSSLKRMCKIANLSERKQALEENWHNINTKFPNWKKNSILKKRTLKNLYIKSNNKITYRIYCFLLSKV